MLRGLLLKRAAGALTLTFADGNMDNLGIRFSFNHAPLCQVSVHVVLRVCAAAVCLQFHDK